MNLHNAADHPYHNSGADEFGGFFSPKSLCTAEVWMINQQTGTCGQGRGSAPPHLQFPRTVAHRKSESTHISQCAHTHIKTCTARKKIPGCSSGYDPITVPLHRPCSQHSDDLLLELVNTGHPEWEGACTSLEAVFHQQTVRSFDLTYQTWNLQ